MTDETKQGRQPVAGLILAGGRGARMGGRDKGLVSYSGKPLIEWAIAGFSPQVNTLSLNVNRSFDHYRPYGYPLLPDEKICADSYPGPLVGIYTGLLHCRHEWLACIPCDVPDVPGNMVNKLQEEIRGNKAAYVFLERGHYLCCLLSVELKSSLRDYLINGGRTVRHWFEEIAAVSVDCSALGGSFMNVNENDQLR